MGGLAEGPQVQRVVATQAGEGSRAQSSNLDLQVKELVHLICFGQSRWGLERPLAWSSARPC